MNWATAFHKRCEDYIRMLYPSDGTGFASLLELHAVLADLQCLVLRAGGPSEACGDYQPADFGPGELLTKVRAAFPSLSDFSRCRDMETMPIERTTCDDYDDLADIAGELLSGIALWRAGDEAGAAAHWRCSYWLHWGDHLLSIQTLLLWRLTHDEPNGS